MRQRTRSRYPACIDHSCSIWAHAAQSDAPRLRLVTRVLQLVARSGTLVPGVGEVAHLVMGVLVVIGNTAFVTHADRFEAIRRQYQQWVTQMLPLPASS